METKPRLFIYDRKEVLVLILLGVMVAAFAFTLGIHLGKKVGSGPIGALPTPTDVPLTQTQPDSVPNRQEFTEQQKGAPQASDEALNQSLHDEVTRTGVRLDIPKQVELPGKAKAENAGATTAGASSDGLTALPPAKVAKAPGEEGAEHRTAPAGKFTLQVGSHQTMEEARDQVDALEALSMKPHLRVADVKGKGKWYRVYLGGYETREMAEEAGSRFQAKKIIESFIVANRVE